MLVKYDEGVMSSQLIVKSISLGVPWESDGLAICPRMQTARLIVFRQPFEVVPETLVITLVLH